MSLPYSGAIALAIRLAGAGGIFLSYAVLVRTMGVAAFGEYALAITWLQTLAVFAKLGLDNTSLRFVSEYATTGQSQRLHWFLSESIRACVCASSIACCGLLLIGLSFRESMGNNLSLSLLVASIMIPVLAIRQIQEASLRGLGRLVQSQISMAIWPVLLCLLVLVAGQGMTNPITPPVATALHLITFCLMSVMVIIFLRRAKQSTEILNNHNKSLPTSLAPIGENDANDRATCRALWASVATAFLLNEALIVAKGRVGVVLAGMVLDRESIGLYAAIERISDVALLGSQSLGLVIAPKFAALFATRNFAEMRKMMRHGQLLMLACTIPFALILSLFSGTIFSILGIASGEGRNTLYLLLASACVASISGPGAYVLQMTGRERTVLWVTAACAVINLTLAPLFMKLWGIDGLGAIQIVTSLGWTVGIWMGLRGHSIWEETRGSDFTE